jgi:cell division protease FtsH
MVCEWGMSDKLGPLTFGDKEGEVFLGRDYGHTKNYSEATAIDIDNEIKRIIDECYGRAKKILKENKKALDDVSNALLERENLEADELKKIVFGEEAVENQDAAGETVAPADGGACLDEANPSTDE